MAAEDEFAEYQKSFMNRMSLAPDPNAIVNYENRFVAFLDILGFKNVMNEIAAKSPNELFHSIVNSYWFQSASQATNIQLISDSIFVTSKSGHPSDYISVANSVNALRNSFLERGLLLRGAISYGPHFHSREILISHALVDAYELEKQSAIYPRILCAQSILDHITPHICFNKNGRSGIVGERYFHVARDQFPVPDFDGCMVLEFLPDTLEVYFLRTGHHHDPFYKPSPEQLKHFRDVGPQLLARWRFGLEKARSRCKKLEHRQKVEYLVGKWNNYIKSFKELSDTEINRYLL